MSRTIAIQGFIILVIIGTEKLIVTRGPNALNRSPEFCLKLTYRYLLKAGHVPGDTWGGANFQQTTLGGKELSLFTQTNNCLCVF